MPETEHAAEQPKSACDAGCEEGFFKSGTKNKATQMKGTQIFETPWAFGRQQTCPRDTFVETDWSDRGKPG